MNIDFWSFCFHLFCDCSLEEVVAIMMMKVVHTSDLTKKQCLIIPANSSQINFVNCFGFAPMTVLMEEVLLLHHR